MTNYRGITVLPPIGKVFEKVMAEQLRLYFQLNDLFFEGQHGFRAAHSCETALHEILSTCHKNIDRNLVNLLLFIDFKKAFDLISPDLLLVKLLNYGLTNDAIEIISNYFTTAGNLLKSGSSSPVSATSHLGSRKGR